MVLLRPRNRYVIFADFLDFLLLPDFCRPSFRGTETKHTKEFFTVFEMNRFPVSSDFRLAVNEIRFLRGFPPCLLWSFFAGPAIRIRTASDRGSQLDLQICCRLSRRASRSMRVQNSRWYGKVNAYIPSREWVYKIPDQVGLIISSKIFRTEVCLEEERKSRDNELCPVAGPAATRTARVPKGSYVVV
jgi:hypothetical protein